MGGEGPRGCAAALPPTNSALRTSLAGRVIVCSRILGVRSARRRDRRIGTSVCGGRGRETRDPDSQLVRERADKEARAHSREYARSAGSASSDHAGVRRDPARLILAVLAIAGLITPTTIQALPRLRVAVTRIVGHWRAPRHLLARCRRRSGIGTAHLRPETCRDDESAAQSSSMTSNSAPRTLRPAYQHVPFPP